MKYLQILANSTHPQERDYGFLPYILLAVGATIWPLSWIYANEHQINFAQASMVRGLCCIVINYMMCKKFQNSIQYREKSSYKYLNIRSFLVMIHGFGFGLSQYILPLPIVHTINCSGTLFIFLIDFLINHVRINFKQAIGIVLGIIGAIVATNGQIITKYFDPSYQMKSKFQNYITDDPFLRMLFSFVFIGIVILWALAMVLTKRVKANTFQNNLMLGVWLLFSGSVVYPFLQTKCTKMQLLISIVLSGIPMAVGQWFYIAALTMTKNTGILNMLSFTAIFVGYLISVFRYDQPPNLVTILGIICVFVGVYKTIFNKEV